MKTNLSPLAPSSILLTMLALSACETASFEPDGDQLRSLSGVCPDDEQIARLSAAGPCPTVGGWSRTSISSRYCKYTWAGLGEPDLESLENESGIAQVGADCGVVTEQGNNSMDATLGPILHDRFLAQVDALSGQEASSFVGAPPQAVTVAIVDTSPTTVPIDGTSSPHGEAMVDIVRDLACSNANCMVNVTRVLALALVEQGQRDLVHGGYLGSLGDLARGIRAAAQLPGGRTIIHLAVGWESALFGDRGDTPAVDAVYEALEFASCRGALIIAAAGNEAGHGEQGPLLPGGWEREAAPSSARCTELGVPNGGQKLGYHPLVFSVSGVELDGDALPNARAGALPRMVSAGAHVNVETDAPTLTGTSTSTAALVGAAAQLWSRFPTLDAPTVMAYLYDTGLPLGFDSNYQLGIAAQPVRQLDVCEAMKKACADVPGCAAQLTCEGVDGLLVDQYSTWLTAANDGILGTPVVLKFDGAACDGGAMSLRSATSDLTCPLPEDPDLAYTSPQPTQPPCPNCTIKKSTGVATLTLDPAYAGDDVLAVDIEVIAAGRSSYYRLGDPGLVSGSVLDVTLSPPPTGYDSATISVTFLSSARAQSNPLLIVQ